MFYQAIPLLPGQSSGRAPATALAVLTPSESKRLIARAVAVLPEVKRALQSGWVIIGRGTTNAFVVEEITGARIEPKVRYAAGTVHPDVAGAARPAGQQVRQCVLHCGQPVELASEKTMEEFGPEDVYIKGANAVDALGNAGVLMGGIRGGIGGAAPILAARGSHLIVPVGLEKLVPSVTSVAPHLALHRYRHSTGMNAWLLPMQLGQVVTEVQAITVLTGATAFHAASGGVGGSEGSVVLVIEGEDAAVDQAWAIIQGIKGEPPVGWPG